MKIKTIILILTVLLLNTIAVYPAFYRHRYYFHHRHFYRNHFYYYHDYPEFIFIETERILVHRMGDLDLPNDLSSDINDIDSIVFSYGINSGLFKTEKKTVYFTDSGSGKVNSALVKFLAKSGVPDNYPDFDNLKSYDFEGDLLKLDFSNNNIYYNNNFYQPDEYFFYTLNYTLSMKYTDAVKSQFDKMESKEFKNEINKYIDRQRRLNAAGVSIFIAGFGLAGLLNVASLITLFYSVNYPYIPRAVPGGLFLGALGSVGISLTVGIPLWASSYARKDYTVSFE